MGMYTEFFYRAELIKETPDQVKDILKAMIEGTTEELEGLTLPDHALFKGNRWHYMCNTYSAYFPMPTESKYHVGGYFEGNDEFAIHANLKNYGNEIGLFCEWIDPWVSAYKDDFVGFYMYEEDTEPTLIRKLTNKPQKKWTGVKGF